MFLYIQQEKEFPKKRTRKVGFWYLLLHKDIHKIIMSSWLPPQRPDVTLSLGLPNLPACNDGLKPEERDVKLIQLLLSCANHASSGNLHHADACLRQISRLASITGDSMQRLAARFASALAVRLVKRWPGLYKSLNNGTALDYCDVDRAREIFERAFPCMEFAYAVINRVLVQTMSGERLIHVIDLGCGNPKLWVPFIRGLHEGSEEFNHGPLHLKITCIGKDKEAQERLGACLVKEAEILNMPFQFNHVIVDVISHVKLDMLKIQPTEALALISILSLHVLLAEDDRVDSHFGLRKNNQIKDTRRLNEFLEMVKSMSPKLVLLVEQESNHNSSRLVDRFVEGLHYYSAIFDSLDVAFGGFSCKDRTTLEEMFGKEIENIVSCEGMEREQRHERFIQWALRFVNVGFRPMRLWSENMNEALKVVEDYEPCGFKVISEKGSLLICWHDRPIYAVSAWNCFRFLANNDD